LLGTVAAIMLRIDDFCHRAPHTIHWPPLSDAGKALHDCKLVRYSAILGSLPFSENRELRRRLLSLVAGDLSCLRYAPNAVTSGLRSSEAEGWA